MVAHGEAVGCISDGSEEAGGGWFECAQGSRLWRHAPDEAIVARFAFCDCGDWDGEASVRERATCRRKLWDATIDNDKVGQPPVAMTEAPREHFFDRGGIVGGIGASYPEESPAAFVWRT
jgi:hypothetical protein